MPFDDEPTVYELTEPTVELDAIAKRVIGAAIEVHRHLGPGHLEDAYQSALAVEMRLRGISFQEQVPVDLVYKGEQVGHGKLDFLVEGQLIVEIKACAALIAIHRVQVESYLAITRHQLALLINFNVPALKDGGIRRIIRSK